MLSGRPFFVAAALALAVGVTVAAQNKPTATLRFEAATIRPSAPDGSPISGTMLEGNRLRGTRTTLLALIRSVYFEEGLISPQQFVDGPQWIRTERWDINAVAVDSPTRAEFNEMLRTLITDRFKLRVRRERRELPVVALLARDDRRLGARLTSVRVDCAAYQEAFAQLQSRPAREPGAPLQPTTCDTLTVVGGNSPGSLDGRFKCPISCGH